jgi:hypothetical protein
MDLPKKFWKKKLACVETQTLCEFNLLIDLVRMTPRFFLAYIHVTGVYETVLEWQAYVITVQLALSVNYHTRKKPNAQSTVVLAFPPVSLVASKEILFKAGLLNKHQGFLLSVDHGDHIALFDPQFAFLFEIVLGFHLHGTHLSK